MIFTVVASGESARHWVRHGTVIGSNDAEKWGQPVDILVLANSPHKFKERIEIIKKSKARVMTTSVRQWKPYFPNCEPITRMTSFNKRISNGFIYTSATTPIMCISLAIRMGAKEIILWGSDMMNHHTYSKGTKYGEREIAVYERFFEQCKKIGVRVYLGAHGTAFDFKLPLCDWMLLEKEIIRVE